MHIFSKKVVEVFKVVIISDQGTLMRDLLVVTMLILAWILVLAVVVENETLVFI